MWKSYNYIDVSDPRTVDVPRISFHENDAVMPSARENDAITIGDEEWFTFLES